LSLAESVIIDLVQEEKGKSVFNTIFMKMYCIT
jgi:hypothetical protein